MTRLPILFAAGIISMAAPLFAQTLVPPSDTADPHVVVLLPSETTIDKGLRREVEKLLVDIRRQLQENVRASRELRDSIKANPQEFRTQGLGEEDVDSALALLPPDPSRVDLGTLASLATANVLGNTLLSKYPTSHVSISFAPPGTDSAGIAHVADAYHASFVASFPTLKLTRKKGKTLVMLHLQLFETEKGLTSLDTTIVADDDAKNSPKGCRNGSFECAMNAATSVAAGAAFRAIIRQLPKEVYYEKLRQARTQALLTEYYGRPVPLRIKNLLPIDSTMPLLSAAYVAIVNPDSSQMVVLYAGAGKHVAYEPRGYGDQASLVSMGDFSSLDRGASTYAFILTGARVNGKWFFAKQNFVYSDAESVEETQKQFLVELQNYNFFRKFSIDPNPEFWSSGLFARVEDPAKMREYDPSSPFFRKLTRESAGYIGMFRFVADQLRSQKQREE